MLSKFEDRDERASVKGEGQTQTEALGRMTFSPTRQSTTELQTIVLEQANKALGGALSQSNS